MDYRLSCRFSFGGLAVILFIIKIVIATSESNTDWLETNKTQIDNATTTHNKLQSVEDFQEVIREVIKPIVENSRGPRDDPDKSLIKFLQESVNKYGEKKVASSIYALAQYSMYDLIWMLAGDLEPWLIVDLYRMYSETSNDPEVLRIYEKFKSGDIDRSVVPEVFGLDKKYNAYDWWKRIRSRMMINVDRYMAGTLQVSDTPPKIEFGSDGKPVITPGHQSQTAAAVAVPAPISTAATKAPVPVAVPPPTPNPVTPPPPTTPKKVTSEYYEYPEDPDDPEEYYEGDGNESEGDTLDIDLSFPSFKKSA